MVFNFYTFNVDDDEDHPNNFPGYLESPSSFSESSTDQACVGCTRMLSSAAPALKNSSSAAAAQPRWPQVIPGYLEPHSSSSVRPIHAYGNGKEMHSFELPPPQNQRKNNHPETEFHFDHVDASRYKASEIIGKGSSGVVCSASDIHTGEKVAIKKISNIFEHLSNATQLLREVKLLRLLRHPDIVEIKHILLPSKRDFQDIYLVFELMESDLHEVIKANDDLTKEHHQFFLYQLLRALKYIHTANVFHRDLKPKNILANANCKLKICDFGSARVAFNDNPTAILWTDYVASRWYRAPELCGAFYAKYSPAIDIWSIGCIFAELLTGKPLFPGKNVGHQLNLITDLLGTPSLNTISQIRNEKARAYLTRMRKKEPIPFERKFPNADPLALRLLQKLLAFEPKDRPTAEEALAHPYFKGLAKVDKEPCCQPITKMEFEFERRRFTEKDIRELIFREILEFHPQLLKDYLNGTTGTHFLHPRSTKIHPNPIPSQEQQKVSSYRDQSTSEETKNRNSGDAELASSSKIAEITQRIGTATFSVNNNTVTIEMLTGSNLKKWKKGVEHAIKIANVELAMVADKPGELTESSTNSEKQIHAAWWKSNHMCYQIMKRTIPENLLTHLPSTTEAKEFLTVVSQRYKISSNAEIDILLRELYSMRYDGVGGIREYIIKMVECQTKLKALDIVLPDACIVHQVLNTLPADYGLFVTTYNSQDEAWGINDLISKCITEEEQLKSEKSLVALGISKPMDKGKGKMSTFSTHQNV